MERFFIRLNFPPIKKMPRTLNPVESQADEMAQPISKITVKRKPSTTNKMVEHALIELHNIKGVTLKQIYNFLLDNYDLESISKKRVVLVKKYLKSLMESEDVTNLTGKGLVGHFKLANKKDFLKKIKTSDKKAVRTSKVTTFEDINSETGDINQNNQVILKRKNVLPKTQVNLKHAPSVLPKPITPIPLLSANSSMLETPMLQTGIRASTPFIASPFIPRYPKAQKRLYEEMSQEINGTPRSSLPEKGRKLRKRNEQ